MVNIALGTTPTILINLNTVSPENFVIADLIGPDDKRGVPSIPVNPESERVINSTKIIVIGVVFAVIVAVVVILGLNKLKNDELNDKQMAFGSKPNPNPEETTRASVEEDETIEEKEDIDEEIK